MGGSLSSHISTQNKVNNCRPSFTVMMTTATTRKMVVKVVDIFIWWFFNMASGG
jgi:hypothetical protein